MKVTATGWSRNMGPTVLGEFDLGEHEATDDQSKRFSFDGLGFYKKFLGKTDLYWGKSLKLTGSYKIHIEFTPRDARQLFRAVHGPLLTADLVEHYGFVVYEDLRKKILKETKLSEFLRSEGVELRDVTLGDLVELKEKRPASDENVTDLTRRV
jgi:hypothetical protein